MHFSLPEFQSVLVADLHAALSTLCGMNSTPLTSSASENRSLQSRYAALAQQSTQ
jgi:hypothetical protein